VVGIDPVDRSLYGAWTIGFAMSAAGFILRHSARRGDFRIHHIVVLMFAVQTMAQGVYFAFRR